MANLDVNAFKTLKPVEPIDGVHNKDGISTTSVAAANDMSEPPQLPENAGWFHWHEPGTCREEKRLIFKIDVFLLSYSCLMFFIKQVRSDASMTGTPRRPPELTERNAAQLDQNNISNAYVSGMSDELGFGPGDELSWMNTYFNIGTIIGGTFANMVITVIRPRYWLPGCLFAWSLFVLFLYKCNRASQFYGLRFCVWLFESAAWPGIMFVIGSWYRKSEIARRSGLFVMSGVLGQMFSGYLQAALYSGMSGKRGLSSWRWLFIFDFILSIPVFIYGVVSSPSGVDRGSLSLTQPPGLLPRHASPDLGILPQRLGKAARTRAH